MKTKLLWMIPAALMAGCVPLSPAPHHSDARAHRDQIVVEAPHVEEAVSARVTRRRQALPESLRIREVAFDGTQTMALSRIAARLSAALRCEVVIEERGPIEGGTHQGIEAPSPIPVSGALRVDEVLDQIALHSAYEWEWEEGAGSDPGRLILYREPPKSTPETTANGWGTREEWRIDPVRHATLRGVLEEWTARAGWTLVWEAEEVDYAVQAPAVFLGTFDAAVDALLRETRSRRTLVPTLWRANRYLTVREAG